MVPGILRSCIRFVACLVGLVILTPDALAIPDFQADLFARYPNARSLGCSACHDDASAGSLNPFGQAYLENGLAFTATFEARDSGGDGVTNGDELRASPASNPGDPLSRPGMGPPPAQPSSEGAALYGSYCASCHGPLASTAQLEAIMAALAPLVPTAPACGSCHEIPPPSGGHARHDARADCTTCHGDGYGRYAVTAGTHNNGVKEVLAAIGWNASAKTCANGCHGTSGWWPTATLGCTSCHGVPPATGRHRDHRERACSTCHGPGYTTTTVNAATHGNGIKEIATSSGWNPTSRSCANSCHGRETW